MGHAVEWVWWWILGIRTCGRDGAQGSGSGCGGRVRRRRCAAARAGRGGARRTWAERGRRAGLSLAGAAARANGQRLAARPAPEPQSRPLAAWRRRGRRAEASAGKSRRRHCRRQGMRMAVGSVKMQPPCESPALAAVAAVAAGTATLASGTRSGRWAEAEPRRASWPSRREAHLGHESQRRQGVWSRGSWDVLTPRADPRVAEPSLGRGERGQATRLFRASSCTRARLRFQVLQAPSGIWRGYLEARGRTLHALVASPDLARQRPGLRNSGTRRRVGLRAPPYKEGAAESWEAPRQPGGGRVVGAVLAAGSAARRGHAIGEIPDAGGAGGGPRAGGRATGCGRLPGGRRRWRRLHGPLPGRTSVTHKSRLQRVAWRRCPTFSRASTSWLGFF
mgnify:CR=1 FL=1